MEAAGNSELFAMLDQGTRLHKAGRLRDAARVYLMALQSDPTHPDVLCLLAMVTGQSGQHRRALDLLQQALLRAPENPDIHHNLGETWRVLGEPATADAAYRRAIALRPGHLDSYRGGADLMQEAARRAAAAGDDRTARHCETSAIWYLRGLADVHERAGRFESAEVALRAALAIDLRTAAVHADLGRVLCHQGRAAEAEAELRRSIALAPGVARSFADLGTALIEQGRLDEAITAYEHAGRLGFDSRFVQQGLISARLIAPLYRAASTPADIFAAHRQWGVTMMAAPARADAVTPPFANTAEPERRLRIGFMSPDLCYHVVSQFLEPLLEALDSAKVEVFCYAEVAKPDAMSDRLRALVAQWRSTTDLGDRALRHRIQDDQIDVLIDLAGHTVGNRLGALAVKPAPVTASWLGYPSTTGLPTIDWRMTDDLADPPGAEVFHTERLLRLTGGFLCYKAPIDAPAVAPLPALARGHVTFGSFNNLAKVTPETIALWAAVLKAVAGGRLIIKAKGLAGAPARQRVLGEFAEHGIAPDRIELRGFIHGNVAHMAAYSAIDIALDPIPYNGTTTTCEALWMGVPVVTLVGDRHAGRVGLSLLAQLGLTRLAAGDPAAYVAIAAALARDVAVLASLRASLRQRLATSPLCDREGFARRFEDGVRMMWRDWCDSNAGGSDG